MGGNIKKYNATKGYESINREMLQDEDNLSLQAIGLLANLTSYADGWTLHKTELYKRFAKSRRRVVETAWNELVENNYIVQLRKRNGKKYDYFYYHSQVPFTENDIKAIEELEQTTVWDGKSSKADNDKDCSTVQNVQSKEKDGSTVQFEQSNLDSSKRTDKKLITKEVYYKDLDTLDTLDTKFDSYNNNNESISSSSEDKRLKEKEKMKQEYMDKAFYANTEKVPERIATMLSVFTETIDEADEYYKVILTAKKNLQNELGFSFKFEEDETLLQLVVSSFSRSIRILEKDRSITNRGGYLYTAIHKAMNDEIEERKPAHLKKNRDSIFFNFLEEDGYGNKRNEDED